MYASASQGTVEDGAAPDSSLVTGLATDLLVTLEISATDGDQITVELQVTDDGTTRTLDVSSLLVISG